MRVPVDDKIKNKCGPGCSPTNERRPELASSSRSQLFRTAREPQPLPRDSVEAWLRSFCGEVRTVGLNPGDPGFNEQGFTGYYERFPQKLQESLAALAAEGIRQAWQLYRLADFTRHQLYVLGFKTRLYLPWHISASDAAAVLWFELSDAEAALAFDESVGSISDALNADILPARYFEPVAKPPIAEEATIIQLMPAQARTWLLVGRVMDNKYAGADDYAAEGADDLDEMIPMRQWLDKPAKVRLV
eukprot:808126-Prymnesium_polylepis.1